MFEMFACMYLYNVRVDMFTCAYLYNTLVEVFACTYVSAKCTYIHIEVFVCTYVHMYLYNTLLYTL